MSSYENKLTIWNLEQLIKANKNEDFKSIVCSINRIQLINMGGNMLMHTAAATNNTAVINFLSDSGFDIDARNELGQTPMHLAILNTNYQAVQLLLSLDADVFIADIKNVSILQLCFQKNRQIPAYIISCVLKRLKRTGCSAQQMVYHLERANCTVQQILALNDADVIGLMMDRRACVDICESRNLLKRAIDFHYPESVRALLKHGPGLNARLDIFLNMITGNKYNPNMKFYFNQIVNWDVGTIGFIINTAKLFRTEYENLIQMYLDINIDVYARNKFDQELLVELFSNKMLNPIWIIKNRHFEVNRLNLYGYTALQAATYSENYAAIEYLLSKGANPNIKNLLGETPVFHCKYHSDSAAFDLLMEAGADVQIINDSGHSVLYKSVHSAANFIIAAMSILEAKGLLKQQLRCKIMNSDYTERMFNLYLLDLKWMKTRHVLDLFNLFSVLANKVEDSARYVKSQYIVMAALEASRERKLQPRYDFMLKKNLEKALVINELRFKAALFLSKVMEIGQVDHLVIEKIVSYLTYRNLLVFEKMKT